MPDTPDAATTPPLVNITGDLVALGPHRRDLLATYLRWINDFGVLRNLGMPVRPMTWEAEERWYDNLTASADEVAFTIYERATWRPVGTTALHHIDYRNRRATFGIMIGEATDRGRGLGTETTQLMLDYAFTALGLHSVNLSVYEFNEAGRRAYLKAGFRETGRRRQAQLMGGRLWDIIDMDCLATEFTSPVLGAVFAPDPIRTS
jgi:RimJ/RimL family protein N-acetyltransferase